MALRKGRSALMASRPAQPGKADGFLWDQPEAPAQSAAPRIMNRSEVAQGIVIDVTPTPANQHLVPAGMFNQWPLEVLLRMNKPFTGLVVLIDLTRTHRRSAHDEGLLQLVTACVAGLLGASDFGCRTTEDEFVMICPGQQGADAQRRLNQISDQLWEFQQREHGACSMLFSWGGIGAQQKPLSEAVAAAVHRMNQLNRKRNMNSMESVKHHRKIV
jgi:GGDEF domain-containing protein